MRHAKISLELSEILGFDVRVLFYKEIIGEASYMLSLDFKDAHPETEEVWNVMN